MGVRTRIIASTRITTGGSSAQTTVFTCPTDRTAIVKEIVLSQTSGSTPTSVWVYIDSGAQTPQIRRFDFSANDVPQRVEVWTVLEEGDELQISQSSGRVIDVHISGTLLDGDPS